MGGQVELRGLLDQAGDESKPLGERILALTALSVRIEAWMHDLTSLAQAQGQEWADPKKLLHVERQILSRDTSEERESYYVADMREGDPTLSPAEGEYIDRLRPAVEAWREAES